jgi:hypothetical protein
VSLIDTVGNLPPVPLTQAENLTPVSLTPVDNLPVVSTTPAVPVAIIAAGGAPWLENISVNFQKKIEMTPMLFHGLGGRKNMNQKMCDTVPLKRLGYQMNIILRPI